MKKNFFIGFSLLLAVALFAFTTLSKESGKSPDPEFYWYTVTYDGNSAMIEYQSPSGPLTVLEATLPLECPGEGRVCRAGFSEPLSFQGTDPITENTDGDEQFEETDPNK